MRGLPLTLVLTTILLLTIPLHGVAAHPGNNHDDDADDEHNENHEEHDDDEHDDEEHENTGDDNHERDDDEDDNDHGDDDDEDDERETEFQLRARPHRLRVHRGESVSATISLKTHGGDDGCSYSASRTIQFDGTVQLTLSWYHNAPSHVTYSFQPTGIGSSESSVLTFMTTQDSTLGKFRFHVHGTLGDQTDSIKMSLRIKASNYPHPVPEPDFAITANPLNLATTAGGSASSTITVTGIRNFNSPVDLNLDWEGEEGPAGVPVTLDPSTVTPNATSSLTLHTTTNSPAGVFSFHIVGTSDGITHQSPEMTLSISSPPPPPPEQGDFRIESISSATIRPGATVTFNITLTSINGFDQTVTLSFSPAAPTGATMTFDPTSTIPTATVRLTVITTSTIEDAIYNFTITGTSGDLTHTETARLTVLPAESPVSQEFPWFWLAIAAILIIGVATAVALRIRRKPPASPTTIPTT